MKEFTENVDGIGAFTFSKRTMALEFRINAEYARLTEGVSPIPPDFELFARAVSTLKVLTLRSPDGWDIDAMDPLEDGTYGRIMIAFGALRAAEERFRAGVKAGSPTDGKGAV